MNKKLRLQVRDADCSRCRMRSEADGLDVCVTAEGPDEVDVLVVSKNPGGRRYKEVLTAALQEVGFDPDALAYTGAVKCRTWEIEPSKTDVKTCARAFLDRELEVLRPAYVIALGNEALTALTGKSGIMKYRGQMTEIANGIKVIPTLSPSMVLRNPGQRTSFVADLNFARNVIEGKVDEASTTPEVQLIKTKDALKRLMAVLDVSDVVAFDLETTGHDEFEQGAAIVSIALTVKTGSSTICAAIPLSHPQSPFRFQWQVALRALLQRLLRRKPKIVAHNGKFDMRWLRQFADFPLPLTFDTMLAAHVLDENREKGLKPLARMMFGAEQWAISTKDLFNDPIDEVLTYNGLDTWWTYKLYLLFRAELVKPTNRRLLRIFKHLMMDGSEELTEAERHGIWVDKERLMTNLWRMQGKLQAVEEMLEQYVPPHEEWPDGIKAVNWNPSNFLRWLIFDHLGIRVIKRGKEKDDGSPGDPSLAEAVMIELKDDHPIIPLISERVWYYRAVNSFFLPYLEQIRDDGRIHTTYKLTGTVTGRLSSGKADEDKVTAKRQIRGVNLQQVPRDKDVRGVFGAPPGSWFVQADQSQVELRIAAHLAQERNMIHHYVTGQDLHMAMAVRMTGKPPSLVTKEERKKAKPVNFGYLYGMSWGKFQTTALVNYGLHFTDQESMASREAFFEMWPDLRSWHARQRKLAHKYKRVVSPLGRVRNLPDIDSPNNGVMAEAERQAINSPVQSLASDLTLLAMNRIGRRLRTEGFKSRAIGTVHDAINFEVPDDEMALVLPLIKTEMENPPLLKLFGVELSIPLVADVSVGTHWGGATELTKEQVFNWNRSYVDAS